MSYRSLKEEEDESGAAYRSSEVNDGANLEEIKSNMERTQKDTEKKRQMHTSTCYWSLGSGKLRGVCFPS